jgi:hypothetical protein
MYAAGRSALLALGIFVTTAACSDADRGGRDGFSIADSAGIRIATSRAPGNALTPALSVAAEPRLRIGVVNGAEELQFSDLGGMVRLDDGRIVVANGRPPEIRTYTPTGSFLKKLGSEGDGPSEFRYLDGVMRGGGDTVLAVSMPRFELLRFTVGTGYVDTWTMPREAIASALGDRRPAEGLGEYLRNGSIVIAARPKTTILDDGNNLPTGQLFRRQFTAVWIVRDRSRTAVLGDLGGIQQLFIDIGGGQRTPVIPPSSRRSLNARNGTGSRLCVAGNDAPEVRCIDDDGKRLIIRWTQDSVPTPREDVIRWREGFRESAARPGSRTSPQIAEKVIAGMLIPPTVPPIRDILVDNEKRVLVGGPDLTAAAGWRRYRVFSADGELVGTADFPAFAVYELGADYAVGRARDEDGVEFVVVHDITRTR